MRIDFLNRDGVQKAARPTNSSGRRRAATTLPRRRLGSSRIDNGADLGNPVRRKTALPGVFANQFLVGRDVINPIIHYVAFNRLNLWSKIAEHSAGFLRDSLEFFAR